MIPVTDQELDTTWRTTTDNEIAVCDWCEIMQEAQAEAMLQEATRRLGLMVLAMTGGVEYDELMQTIEYENWQEDEAWMRGGC